MQNYSNLIYILAEGLGYSKTTNTNLSQTQIKSNSVSIAVPICSKQTTPPHTHQHQSAHLQSKMSEQEVNNVRTICFVPVGFAVMVGIEVSCWFESTVKNL